MPAPTCFDLDGCLVDSRGPITAGLNHGLEAVGAPRRPPAELEGWIGTPLLATFEGLLAEVGHDPARARDAVTAYRQVYGELAAHGTVAIDGMPELVDALVAAGRRLLVVTTKPVAFAAPILETVGMRGAFDGVFAPDLTSLHEPKAVTLRRALDTTGVADGAVPDVWMVGDRHHDVDAGVAVGTRTAGVTWGAGSRHELEAAGADVVVDTPGALTTVLLGPRPAPR